MGDTHRWWDRTWNPVVGCSHASAGCDHCYARALHDRRYLSQKRGHWPSAPAQYRKPFKQVQLMQRRLGDPLRWRKPQRVFVCSMSDLFHEALPDNYIRQVYGAMKRADQHMFLALTKRPERLHQPTKDTDGMTVPLYDTLPVLPNVHLGVSVENQEAADERIPPLLETPAAKRFVSVEPMLGPVDLTMYIPEAEPYRCPSDVTLDWVIVGGECGLNARRMDLAWVEALYEQCQAAGLPYFGKQTSGPVQGMPLPGRVGERSVG